MVDMIVTEEQLNEILQETWCDGYNFGKQTVQGMATHFVPEIREKLIARIKKESKTND